MERITVNMSPTAMLETCHASQFDVGVQKRFDLVDGSSAYTLTGAETITLKIRTPDGTLVESNVPNTSDSYVIWTSGAGELDAFGICLCSIHITNGSDELGSGNFIMEVEMDPYNGKNLRIVTVGPADICTFDTTLPEPLQSAIVNVTATQASGTPTPSSPLAISGYTGLNLTVCGKNLFDKNGGNVLNAYLSTKIEALAVCRTVFVKCKPSTTYTVIKTAGQRFIVAYTKELPDINVDIYGSIQDATASNITITTGADAKYIVAMVYNGNVDSGTAEEMLASVQIAEGTDTTYHAYNGTTYTIAFGQTVYGGVLDVTRGKLVVTHGFITIDGSANWSNVGGQYPQAFQLDTYISNLSSPSPSTQALENKSNLWPWTTEEVTNFGIRWQVGTVSGRLYVYDTDYALDLPGFKALLNNTPLQIAYKLATPFDIDLTPEQIRAIVGTNNVFADCGETTVEYLTEE